jgi:hypothetical protein
LVFILAIPGGRGSPHPATGVGVGAGVGPGVGDGVGVGFGVGVATGILGIGTVRIGDAGDFVGSVGSSSDRAADPRCRHAVGESLHRDTFPRIHLRRSHINYD